MTAKIRSFSGTAKFILFAGAWGLGVVAPAAEVVEVVAAGAVGPAVAVEGPETRVLAAVVTATAVEAEELLDVGMPVDVLPGVEPLHVLEERLVVGQDIEGGTDHLVESFEVTAVVPEAVGLILTHLALLTRHGAGAAVDEVALVDTSVVVVHQVAIVVDLVAETGDDVDPAAIAPGHHALVDSDSLVSFHILN